MPIYHSDHLVSSLGGYPHCVEGERGGLTNIVRVPSSPPRVILMSNPQQHDYWTCCVIYNMVYDCKWMGRDGRRCTGMTGDNRWAGWEVALRWLGASRRVVLCIPLELLVVTFVNNVLINAKK